MNLPDVTPQGTEKAPQQTGPDGSDSPTRPATRLNVLGYRELVDTPDEAELADYYARKYYQQSIRTHRPTYSAEELLYRSNKIEQKLQTLTLLRDSPLPQQAGFLDIGAGEGFAMDFFHLRGWEVVGLDYSAHGCQTHHPHLSGSLVVGDIQQSIETLIAEGRQFDAILLDNVLEHVLDPARLVARIAKLMSPSSILTIEVPNDFSLFQNYLLEKQVIDQPFWIVSPDHISYFNRQGLINLLKSEGYTDLKILSDFPIDLFLFNEHTNYAMDKQVGKSCHAARLAIENLLHTLPMEGTNRLYESMAEIGIGRQLIGYFRRNA